LDKFNDNDDLPSAGMDSFASPVKPNRSHPPSPWSRWLISAGALSSLFSCVAGIGARVVQYGVQEDWEGYYAFISLCPVPCAAPGIILLIAGALPRMKKNQIQDS